MYFGPFQRVNAANTGFLCPKVPIHRKLRRDPTLISGVFAFELREGVTEEQAMHLAQQMTDLLSHLMYTPR
jgi:hypothetical protein